MHGVKNQQRQNKQVKEGKNERSWNRCRAPLGGCNGQYNTGKTERTRHSTSQAGLLSS